MPPGAQKIGRYEVVEMIGQGGMGRVYRARDPLIDRIVAIKTIELSAAGGKQDELRQRILREVRAAGRLLHPNIVQVFDVGELPDKAYIVMEMVEGRTLWDLYDADERPAPAEAVKILQQIGDALDYAHQQGIIHRDVKPGNILIDGQGSAKITDFGIARILTDERLTQTGMIVGTPHYMAPEQLQETGVGPEADQFALTVNAYELLTGAKPFDGESFSSLLYMVLNEEPPSATELRPELPAAVEEVLAKGLAKDRGARYPSCRAMADALAAALDDGQETRAAPAAAAPQRKSAPWGWIAGGLAAAALAGAVFLRPQPEPASQEPEPPAVVEQAPETAPAEASAPTEAPPETAATPPRISPSPAPVARPSAPPQSSAQQPPPEPASAVVEPSASATGPTVTVVWRGRLDPGEALLIDNGKPSAGTLSRPLPSEPISVEVSPSAVEVVEAPSAQNGWSKLRVRNAEHERTMFFVRYKRLQAER